MLSRKRHRRELQWLSYKFNCYRETGTDPRRAVVAEHRKLELPLPPEERHGLTPARGPVEFKPFSYATSRPNLNELASAVGLGKRHRAAFERLRDTNNWFNGPDLHYQKVLGYGNSNIAIHYKYGNGEDTRDFVLKVGLKDRRNDVRIRREARMLHKVRRSQHIVQAIPKENIGRIARLNIEFPPENDDSDDTDDSSSDDSVPGDTVPEPKEKRQTLIVMERNARESTMKRRCKIYERRQEQEDEHGQRDIEAAVEQNNNNVENEHPNEAHTDAQDCLLLEYMENGDLESLICRLNEQDKRCPNRVLWSFWVCLIRACIAMAYPVHKFNPRRNDSAFEGALDEMVPGSENKRKWIRPLVHFAINPSNVLIGRIPSDISHDEHQDGVMPILKLGSFGLAEVTMKQKRNWYYERRRTWGKHGYYAPEQFVEAWDKFEPDASGSNICNEPIAGNYGPAMNIWGIATTMMCLITRCEPVTPPRAARVRIEAREGDKSTKWWNHYSYGAMMIQEPDNEKWSYADEELRETLVKCLARDPAYRPDLKYLLDQAVEKCQEEGPYVYSDGETPATNEYVLEWIQGLLRNARPGQQLGP